MSRPPIRNIDPRRITGIKPPNSIREVQAALVLKNLGLFKNGTSFAGLEDMLRTGNELNRPELKAAVDLLLTLHLASTKIVEGRIHIYEKS